MRAAPHIIADQWVEPAPDPPAALMFIPLIVAIGFPLVGCIMNHGPEDKELHQHRFDRVFKSAGTLMALPPLLIRLLASQLLPDPGAVQRSSYLSSHSISLFVQIAFQVVRVTIYSTHNWTIRAGFWAWLSGGRTDHIMADHVVLALAVSSSLCCEIAACVLAARTLLLKHPRRVTLPTGLFLAGGLYAWIMLVVVSGNMFNTARWFHIPAHTICAMLVGVPLFYYPAAWLVYKHCVPFRLPEDGSYL
jgi:hypothetical protein